MYFLAAARVLGVLCGKWLTEHKWHIRMCTCLMGTWPIASFSLFFLLQDEQAKSWLLISSSQLDTRYVLIYLPGTRLLRRTQILFATTRGVRRLGYNLHESHKIMYWGSSLKGEYSTECQHLQCCHLLLHWNLACTSVLTVILVSVALSSCHHSSILDKHCCLKSMDPMAKHWLHLTSITKQGDEVVSSPNVQCAGLVSPPNF